MMLLNWNDRALKSIGDALELHDTCLRSKQSLERARYLRKHWAITHQTMVQIKNMEIRANDAMSYINEACDAISTVELCTLIMQDRD